MRCTPLQRHTVAVLTLAAMAAVQLLVAAPAQAETPAGPCALAPTGANLTEGVPNPAGHTPSLGTVKATMIFVDFPDAPANDTTASLRDRLVPSGPDWFATASYGQFSLSVTAATARFHRMPRKSTDYGWDRGLSEAQHRVYIADALAAVGTSVSFTGTKLLYIVPTRAATAISFSPTFMSAITAGDGTVIPRSVTFGQDIWHTGWGGKVLNHESGHAMGLPDLYAYSGDGHRFVGGWDLMGWIPGPAPDLLAWHKWKLGWLANSQVACVSAAGRYTETLTPIEVTGGRKMVVVRTSATRAWVAEARSQTGLDAAACSTGVLVYALDTAVHSGSGPIVVKDSRPGSGGCSGHELNDAAYGVGGAFQDTATNTTIKVTGAGGGNWTVTVDFGVPAGGCTGYQHRYTGSLASNGTAYQPNNSYWYTGNAGQHTACLDGPTGADYDLYLEKWNGSAWAAVASGTTASPDETLTYSGAAGYYRYRVHAYSGSGGYVLGYTTP